MQTEKTETRLLLSMKRNVSQKREERRVYHRKREETASVVNDNLFFQGERKSRRVQKEGSRRNGKTNFATPGQREPIQN